jgi:hypothetical protein
MWMNHGDDTLHELRAVVGRLRRAGYEFLATHGMYERLAPQLGMSCWRPERT